MSPPFDGRSRDDKMKTLWDLVMKDTTPAGFASPISYTTWKLAVSESLGGLNFWDVGEVSSDQFLDGRPKAIHSTGWIAKAKFKWNQDVVKKYGFTGGFTEPESEVLARFSAALDPGPFGAIPNFAVKHLRSGAPSANMQFGHGLSPTAGDDAYNFFVPHLCNHVPNKKVDWSASGLQARLTNAVFSKGPDYHGITSPAEYAQRDHTGALAKKVVSPFSLCARPRDEIVKTCKGLPLIGSNFGCFDKLPAGSVLYDIFAIPEPVVTPTAADIVQIGTLQTTSKFTTSMFADKQMYFKHCFQTQELEILGDVAKKWYQTATVDTFMDHEGPEKYKPLMNAWAAKQGKRRNRRLRKFKAQH